MHKVKPGPGQESVWDYPRPPRLELSSKTVQVLFNGQVIAQTNAAYRVLETSHPPSWYLPAQDVRLEFFTATPKTSFCEWKGRARYWTVMVDGMTEENGAWSYPSPTAHFAPIKDYLAFYASRFQCFVEGERVMAQPGDFYGGWITNDVVGPFKGAPGTCGW